MLAVKAERDALKARIEEMDAHGDRDMLLAQWNKAAAERARVRYSDLVKEWGIRQSVIGTALQRGIKQYDYILWKQGELR